MDAGRWVSDPAARHPNATVVNPFAMSLVSAGAAPHRRPTVALLLSLLLPSSIVVSCAEPPPPAEPMAFDRLFTLEDEIILNGSEDLPLFAPTKVTATRDQVYVLDRALGRVLVFDSNGTVVGNVGTRGLGPGELLSPTTFTVSGLTGALFVYDEGPDKVSIFNNSFDFVKSIALTTPAITDLQWTRSPAGDELIIVVGMHTKYGARGYAALIEALDPASGTVVFNSEPVRSDGFLLQRFPAAVGEPGTFFVANQLTPELHLFAEKGDLVRSVSLMSPSFQAFAQSMPLREMSTERMLAEFKRLETEAYTTIEGLVAAAGRLLVLIEQRHNEAPEKPRFILDVYNASGDLTGYGMVPPGQLLFGDANRVFFGNYDASGFGAFTIQSYAMVGS